MKRLLRKLLGISSPSGDLAAFEREVLRNTKPCLTCGSPIHSTGEHVPDLWDLYFPNSDLKRYHNPTERRNNA